MLKEDEVKVHNYYVCEEYEDVKEDFVEEVTIETLGWNLECAFGVAVDKEGNVIDISHDDRADTTMTLVNQEQRAQYKADLLYIAEGLTKIANMIED